MKYKYITNNLKDINTPNLIAATMNTFFFEKSIWPALLKIAEVVPVHKFGDKHYGTNYRAISLISNAVQIF